jgi:hypothetical protein
MAERKIKTVTTPSGVPVELKEYISAGEFLDATESKDATEISKSELARKIISIAVVSVGGSKENVFEALRELPLPDYLFLSKEVAQLTNADFTQAKTSP